MDKFVKKIMLEELRRNMKSRNMLPKIDPAFKARSESLAEVEA